MPSSKRHSIAETYGSSCSWGRNPCEQRVQTARCGSSCVQGGLWAWSPSRAWIDQVRCHGTGGFLWEPSVNGRILSGMAQTSDAVFEACTHPPNMPSERTCRRCCWPQTSATNVAEASSCSRLWARFPERSPPAMWFLDAAWSCGELPCQTLVFSKRVGN